MGQEGRGAIPCSAPPPGLAAVLLIRVAAGPTVSDRIVALNTMSTQVTLAVLLCLGFAGTATTFLIAALG